MNQFYLSLQPAKKLNEFNFLTVAPLGVMKVVSFKSVRLLHVFLFLHVWIRSRAAASFPAGADGADSGY